MRELSLTWLAWQNLRRKPYRALLIGICVAVATGCLFALTLLLRGVEHSLAVGRARLGADLVIVPAGYESAAQEVFISGQPTTFYMPGSVERQIAALPGVQQVSSQVFVSTLSNARCCIGKFFLIGFDPLTDFTISPWLATHLQKESLGSFDLIVGDRILLREGDSVTFYGTNFTVAGVLEKTGMGIDRTIFVPLQGLREMIEKSPQRAVEPLRVSPDEISSVLVKVAPGARVIDVAEAIEERLSGVQAFTASQLNQAIGRQLRGLLGITFGVTGVLWMMSLLTIGLVFSLVVHERQRELGLMRAMGARRGFIFRLVVAEAAMLTGLGGLGGVLGAGALMMALGWVAQARWIYADQPLAALARLMQLSLKVPYLMPGLAETVSVELILLVLAVLAGALASLPPALSSSRMEPYAAIRQGE